MACFKRIRWIVPALLLAPGPISASDDVGPLVRSLWLMHRYGKPDAVRPENDQTLKGTLSKALGKKGILTASGVQRLMDSATFARIAGADGQLDASEIRNVVDENVPAACKRLLPKVAAYADALTTSFDMIDEAHREAAEKVVDWIVKNYKPGQPLHLTTICTANSRRSMIGATLGNIASAYYGMPEIQFHCGGTRISAINRRAIAALKEIGVVIEPTGVEAARGEPKTRNPIYRVRWGETGPSEPPLETTEFSKTYFDPSNPQTGFAALMVCGEADASCPVVKGASVRISMPYLDPKIYDDSAFESQKYAERRDDMGRFMLCVLMQVRNRLNPQPSR